MENDDGSGMDFFDSKYFRLMKMFMSMVGIWPYQKYKARIPRLIVANGVIIVSVSSVGAKFFTIEYEIDEIVDILVFLIPIICYLIGYVTIQSRMSKVKLLLDWIKFDWGILQSSEEFNIIKRYSIKSKKLSIFLTVMFYIFISAIIFTYTLPTILYNINMPVNGTRERKCPFPFETFINFEETTLGAITILVILTMLGFIAIPVYSGFLIMVYHTCGMFTITGYILEHAFLDNDRCVGTRKERDMIGKRIDRSIRFHIRTIKYFENIKYLSEVCYSINVGLVLLLITADYVKIMFFERKKLLEDRNDVVIVLFHTLGTLLTLFINCHAGQEIINHSMNVFHKASVAPWYLASKKTRKSALIILMRSQVPCYVEVGKVFVSSYEFFTSILKSSMSCATVFYTLQ